MMVQPTLYHNNYIPPCRGNYFGVGRGSPAALREGVITCYLGNTATEERYEQKYLYVAN